MECVVSERASCAVSSCKGNREPGDDFRRTCVEWRVPESSRDVGPDPTRAACPHRTGAIA